jgi:hypothetical protein
MRELLGDDLESSPHLNMAFLLAFTHTVLQTSENRSVSSFFPFIYVNTIIFPEKNSNINTDAEEAL